MICLFFDTSSDLLKVSLIKDNKIIFDKELHTKNDHSSYLVPTIDEAFKSNNIDFKELDEIIVGNGPGSFTGTRISIAVAKTYAFSFNIPVYMISSLEELIYDNDEYDFYVPIIEEKKENLYFSIFDKDKKRVMDDTYSSTEYMYKKLEELDGKILLISLSDKEYEKYDTVKASINALNIMKNIDVNNEKVNPHLLKPNSYVTNNKVVAFLLFNVMYEKCEIVDIFVLKEYRNKGIASKLINEITNDYTVDNITLEVSMLNKNAINLYEKLGFKKIAVRKNYYKDSDGILMLKEVR